MPLLYAINTNCVWEDFSSDHYDSHISACTALIDAMVQENGQEFPVPSDVIQGATLTFKTWWPCRGH